MSAELISSLIKKAQHKDVTPVGVEKIQSTKDYDVALQYYAATRNWDKTLLETRGHCSTSFAPQRRSLAARWHPSKTYIPSGPWGR